LTEKLLC